MAFPVFALFFFKKSTFSINMLTFAENHKQEWNILSIYVGNSWT